MKKILIAIIVSAGLFSCELQTVDQSNLAPSVALDNAPGVQSVLFSGYRRLHLFNFFGQDAMLVGDALADNIEIVNRTGRYEQEWVNAVGTFANRYQVAYQVINDANFVIKFAPLLDTALTRIVPRTAPTTATPNPFWADDILNQVKGEAHFIRALSYMELLRIYSYEPGKEQGGFDLGVVLRDTPTEAVSNVGNRSRSTNLECYQFVENDLIQAISLMRPRSEFATRAWPTGMGAFSTEFRAHRGTAHALLARLYLYWGRYADADAQATLALSLIASPALVTAANYAASWSTTTHPESIFELEIRPADWSGVDGPNNSLHSITQNALSGAQYVMAASQELINAHEPGDVRRGLYVTSAGTLNKPQVRKWQGEKGSFVENIPVMRRSEMYLIQAESRARQSNNGGAQTAINVLRTNRGLTATTFVGPALVNLIMIERRVELAFEGHRFFDLKRLGLDVPKPSVSNASMLPFSDFRILQQIPPDQVVLNSSLRQNPNY
jgi:starch-binding outer membrane protein, SusD/RagB family